MDTSSNRRNFPSHNTPTLMLQWNNCTVLFVSSPDLHGREPSIDKAMSWSQEYVHSFEKVYNMLFAMLLNHCLHLAWKTLHIYHFSFIIVQQTAWIVSCKIIDQRPYRLFLSSCGIITLFCIYLRYIGRCSLDHKTYDISSSSGYISISIHRRSTRCLLN